jgi:hypothetical protein
MKWIIIIMAIITGGFMLIDGIHVMLKGKYIGPPEPGPWAALFQKMNVDVFKLGPLFIAFGLAWLVFVAGLWMQRGWSYPLGIAVAVLTLWYLPVGTLFSIVVLIMLIAARTKLGI